jgi:hypothetical protein
VDPLARASARTAPSRLALAGVKALAWSGLLGVVLASGTPASTPVTTPDRADARPSTAQAADRPECTAALIRTADGAVRRVRFAVGWDVYTGRRPGTLIAACLDGAGAD